MSLNETIYMLPRRVIWHRYEHIVARPKPIIVPPRIKLIWLRS